MKDINIYYFYVVGLIICLCIQVLMGNIGIIFMIFISVCILHDFLLNQFEKMKGGTRKNGR